jgi:hypothetical protein
MSKGTQAKIQVAEVISSERMATGPECKKQRGRRPTFSSSATIDDAFQPVFSRNAKTVLCCSVVPMMTRSSRCDSPARRQRHNANLPSGLANQKLEHPMRRLVAAGFLCASSLPHACSQTSGPAPEID